MKDKMNMIDSLDNLKQKMNQNITLVISDIINNINDCLSKLLQSCIEKADYLESMVETDFAEWKGAIDRNSNYNKTNKKSEDDLHVVKHETETIQPQDDKNFKYFTSSCAIKIRV